MTVWSWHNPCVFTFCIRLFGFVLQSILSNSIHELPFFEAYMTITLWKFGCTFLLEPCTRLNFGIRLDANMRRERYLLLNFDVGKVYFNRNFVFILASAVWLLFYHQWESTLPFLFALISTMVLLQGTYKLVFWGELCLKMHLISM